MAGVRPIGVEISGLERADGFSSASSPCHVLGLVPRIVTGIGTARAAGHQAFVPRSVPGTSPGTTGNRWDRVLHPPYLNAQSQRTWAFARHGGVATSERHHP